MFPNKEIHEHEAISKLITYRVVTFLLLEIKALKQTRTIKNKLFFQSCFSKRELFDYLDSLNLL